MSINSKKRRLCFKQKMIVSTALAKADRRSIFLECICAVCQSRCSANESFPITAQFRAPPSHQSKRMKAHERAVAVGVLTRQSAFLNQLMVGKMREEVSIFRISFSLLSVIQFLRAERFIQPYFVSQKSRHAVSHACFHEIIILINFQQNVRLTSMCMGLWF